MRPHILVLNGPNLNLLGLRQPEIYGRDTLADVEANCREIANELGLALEFRQSNAEHQLIDWIYAARTSAAGLIINPAPIVTLRSRFWMRSRRANSRFSRSISPISIGARSSGIIPMFRSPRQA